VRGWFTSSQRSALQYSPGEMSVYWEGGGAVAYDLGGDASLLLGAAYTQRLGRPGVHGVLGLTWSNGGPLSADLLLPMQGAVRYSAGRFDLGLAWRSTGDVYATGDIVGMAPEVRELRFGRTTIGPSLRARLGESMAVLADAGTTLRRRLDAPDSGVTFEPETARYFRIGLEAGLR
jgi:hypothetical protein